jgi:hypothetical protein
MADTRATEILFVVEDDPEGGLVARAVGASIITQAETMDGLKEAVRDAVACHFEEAERPKLIRLHYVRDEVIAA